MTDQTLIIGLILIGLLGVITIWRILRHHEQSPNLLEILLVLGGTSICVLALTLENGNDTHFDISEIATLAAGVAFIQVGLWGMWILERPFQSRGLLAFGTGVVLAAAALILPVYAASSIRQPTFNLAVVLSPTPDVVLVSDSQQSTTQMPAFSTPLPASAPMTIPTLALPELHFSTPTPTPQLPEACEATVTTRLNLRDLPSTAAGEILTVMPEHATVALYGQDDSGEWWFTITDDHEGWLHGDYLDFTADCGRLPVRNWAS